MIFRPQAGTRPGTVDFAERVVIFNTIEACRHSAWCD